MITPKRQAESIISILGDGGTYVQEAVGPVTAFLVGPAHGLIVIKRNSTGRNGEELQLNGENTGPWDAGTTCGQQVNGYQQH